MNIQPKQHIKCIFRNSTIIEGIVQSWSKEGAVLLSLNDDSLMVILHPSDDVMLVKVMPQEIVEEGQPEAAPANGLPLRGTLEPTAEEEPLDPMALNAKTKAQLKIQMAEEERKIVANKLKDHHPNTSQAPRKVTYGYPGFFKKPSA